MAAQAQVLSKQKKLSSSSQNIKVVVRVRPLSDDEQDRRTRVVVQCISMREIQAKEKKYHFDRVFNAESSQLDVYRYVVAPMIHDVLAGYNCTVFAYGQTGSGKTHTMTGGDPTMGSGLNWKQDELAGCIPRAAANIFDEIGSMKVTDYNVRVSFLELYNEEVRDLLCPDERQPPLSIFNDSKGSVCIQNLTEVTVFNSNDIYMLLQQGTLKRQTAATLMNNHSSRSHTVFTITVHTREANITGEEVLKTGKINLVDLAGSENIAKSGAKDRRAQELANINRSLLTLGRVIHILAEKNNKHVPYRDSKLTRILQDSLGGHTKTCIIATVSPSHWSYEETQSTLDYACRARDIRNTPMVNEKVTKAQMMKEMTQAIEKLKKDLDAARSGEGFFVDRMNWEQMNTQLQSSSNALTLKNEIIDDMKKKLSDLETVRDIKMREFEEVMNVCQNKEKIIGKAKMLLKEKTRSLRQEEYLSQCYFETATETSRKNKLLLEATNNLSRNQDVFQRELESQLENMKNVTSLDIDGHKMNIDRTKSILGDFEAKDVSFENESRSALLEMLERQQTLIHEISQNSIDGNEESQKKINQMLGHVNDAHEQFEKYDGEVTDWMRNFIFELQCRYKKSRKKKMQVLKNFEMFADITKEEIAEIDSALDDIEAKAKYWKCNEGKEADSNLTFKTEFEKGQQKLQLLIQDLESNTDYLAKQTECISKNETRLLASNEEIKENVEETVTTRINSTKNFVNDSVAQLKSLEENIEASRQSLENNITEMYNTLQNADATRIDIVTKVIPLTRGTPRRNSQNLPWRLSMSALTRDVLLEKFNEEFSEGIEDESFHLNVSSDSNGPLPDVNEECGISTKNDAEYSRNST